MDRGTYNGRNVMGKSLGLFAAVALIAALGCSTPDQIAGLNPATPIGAESGQVALLTNPANEFQEKKSEVFVCPKCHWETKKTPNDDQLLDGFYERISAHGRECFNKSRAELNRLIQAWRTRQDNHNVRVDRFNGKVSGWKTRQSLFSTAQDRWNEDAKKYDYVLNNYNRRVEAFNEQYDRGKKLDPPTFNYASGLKSNFDAEKRKLDEDKDTLLMLKRGLDNNRAALERELAALKQEQSDLNAEQKNLDKEREELQTMLKGAEK
jgi:hypothetical protein